VPGVDAEVNDDDVMDSPSDDGSSGDDDALFDIEARLLLEAIHLRYSHDFRDYAIASLRRRMRQAMLRFDVPRLSELQDRLLRDPALFTQMLSYLTVQVSDLFRDPGYFRVLRTEVLPLLRTYPSIKIWVAGCSTGEEVWSLLILLAEEQVLDRTIVYATDINAESLGRAREGVYEQQRYAQFSRNYLAAGGTGSLSDYASSAYGRMKFDAALRRQVVFADHSLATDSVFSEVHLVSCRNVLIYFNAALRDRALRLFDEALVRRGFLGLGSHETLQFSPLQAGYAALRGASGERLYQKLGSADA